MGMINVLLAVMLRKAMWLGIALPINAWKIENYIWEYNEIEPRPWDEKE
jgi:hypothetical protein